jgi:hypothetical protein
MSNVIIPTSDEDKKRIKDCVIEISNAKTMIEANRDFIREAINSCVEDVEVDKKHLRKMAEIYHKQNLLEVVGAVEDVEALYESVMS